MEIAKAFVAIRPDFTGFKQSFDAHAVLLARRLEVKADVKPDVQQMRKAALGLADTVADAFKGIARTIGDNVSNLSKNAATGITNLTTNVFNLIPIILTASAVIAGIPAAIVAMNAAILVGGGAMGAMTTAAVGLAGSMAVIKLGTSGLSDAFSEVSEKGKASAETLAKLSPNARELVHAFEGLQGPLGNLRRFVQDRLLEGMGSTLTTLANRYLPTVRTAFGQLADTFNGIIRSIAGALGQGSFISNITAALGGFRQAIAILGTAMAPLIDAFGRLARASVPFLKEMATWLASVLKGFSAWIAKADQSGKLNQFFKDAAKTFQDIAAIGGSVFRIIGQIIGIIFDSSKKETDSVLGGLRRGLKGIEDWLAKPENQKKIKDFITGIKVFIAWVRDDAIPALVDFGNRIAGWVKKIEEYKAKFDSFVAGVKKAWSTLTGIPSAIGAIPGQVGDVLNSVKAKVVAKGKEIGAKAKEAGADLAEKLRSAASAATGKIQGVMTGVREKVSGAKANISNAAKTVGQAVSDKLREGASTIGGRVGTILTDVRTRISNAQTNIANAARTVGQAISDKAREGANSLPGRMATIMSSVRQKIDDAKANLKAAAGRAVQAVVDGFKSIDLGGRLKDFVSGAIDKVKSFLGIKSPSKVFEGIGSNMIRGLLKGIVRQPTAVQDRLLNLLGGAKAGLQKVGNQILGIGSGIIGKISGLFGGAGGDAAGWVRAAMRITGVPESWFGPLMARMMQESGGNPRAINLWDINARRGIPSKGLFQTIDPTFQAFRDRRLPNDIWNPVANAVAAINYMKQRYGSVFNLPQGGYFRGGPITETGIFSGHQGEYVLSKDVVDRIKSGRTSRGAAYSSAGGAVFNISIGANNQVTREQVRYEVNAAFTRLDRAMATGRRR